MGPKATGIVGALLGYTAHNARHAIQKRLGSDCYQPPAKAQTARPGCARDQGENQQAGGGGNGWLLLFGDGQR